ncbi:hypothetical protein SELMODRAFT_88885 [Selaginella moellendorffii]|uniref:AB hydrolase-1 domain-containing protein n=1 Tax=Selaginella moellendorffii TaxID=88036 RepID=D8R9U7_SELML|nr:methylesterase 17 [Selaginella moellendorffii]EFJ31217.1 hypothetical protein SELMODRAFT_88885 [Selaginella moellendorffii]|eukprot:XP_002967870.1 methylesterase 17 [Selaginella moellendorffii]
MTKPCHFVLVHGGSHGAWCWYKIVNLLQASGHKVTALDLSSCGTHTRDAETVTSFAEYTQPLIDFLSKVQDKVVLVGHSLGGVSVVHASEQFPEKVAVSVYIAAAMFPVGLQTQEAEINLVRATESFPDKMHFTFANGVENGPTTVMVRKDFVREAFYHLSPAEDVALASILLRPSPIAAVSKVNFSTSKRGYGSVPRVYVKTEKDRSFSPREQDIAVTKSLPDKVYSIESDHSPFFSAPQELHQLLLQIAADFCR